MTGTRRGAGMETKLAKLKRHMATGEHVEALRLCAKWHDLGAHKERITRGWAAYQYPQFYREIGQDPDALFADALAAIRERYGLPTGGMFDGNTPREPTRRRSDG
jgi:hypothetical protein